jgi:hypothetical protein
LLGATYPILLLFLLIKYFSLNNSLTQDESDSDDDDDSDDSSNWESDSSSSSSEDSDDAGGEAGELKGRARWLKRTTVVKEKVSKDKVGRSEERKRAKEEAAKLRAQQEEEAREKGQLAEEYRTPSAIQKRSLEILSSRGRKGSDPRVLLGQLENLASLAARFGPRVEIPVLMQVITAQFDMQRAIDDYMETQMWRSCAGYIERIGSILDDEAEGWKIGPMTGEEEELANDMMMSTMLGAKAGKGKMSKGMAGGMEGAMTAMSAEEKLINPHTVSYFPSILSTCLQMSHSSLTCPCCVVHYLGGSGI